MDTSIGTIDFEKISSCNVSIHVQVSALASHNRAEANVQNSVGFPRTISLLVGLFHRLHVCCPGLALSHAFPPLYPPERRGFLNLERPSLSQPLQPVCSPTEATSPVDSQISRKIRGMQTYVLLKGVKGGGLHLVACINGLVSLLLVSLLRNGPPTRLNPPVTSYSLLSTLSQCNLYLSRHPCPFSSVEIRP